MLFRSGKPIELNEELFLKQLDELKKISNEDSINIRKKVQEIVPTYVIKG